MTFMLKRIRYFWQVFLAAKAKQEVDYDNPKWYRNIVFDESSLKRLTELFPEREIKTDYDAVRLAEELGGDVLNELQKEIERENESLGHLQIRSKERVFSLPYKFKNLILFPSHLNQL